MKIHRADLWVIDQLMLYPGVDVEAIDERSIGNHIVPDGATGKVVSIEQGGSITVRWLGSLLESDIDPESVDRVGGSFNPPPLEVVEAERERAIMTRLKTLSAEFNHLNLTDDRAAPVQTSLPCRSGASDAQTGLCSEAMGLLAEYFSL